MIVQRVAEHTLPQSDANAGSDVLIWRVVRDLIGQVLPAESAGLRITIETGVHHLREVGYQSVGINWKAQTATYDCMCGWSTENLGELVIHLRDHGAERVVVTPETWSGLKGRRK